MDQRFSFKVFLALLRCLATLGTPRPRGMNGKWGSVETMIQEVLTAIKMLP